MTADANQGASKTGQMVGLFLVLAVIVAGLLALWPRPQVPGGQPPGPGSPQPVPAGPGSPSPGGPAGPGPGGPPPGVSQAEFDTWPQVTVLAPRGGRTGFLQRAKQRSMYATEKVRINLYGMGDAPGQYVPLETSRFAESTADDQEDERQICRSVAEGKAEGACVRTPIFLEAVDKGLPLVAVAALGYAGPRSMVLNKGMHRLDAATLRGKTVGLSEALLDEPLLRETVKSLGLTLGTDVKYVVVKDPDELPAGLGNRFDALLLGPFRAEILVRDGKAGWGDRVDWPLLDPKLSTISNLLVFRKDYAEKHPELVKTVVTGIGRAVAEKAGGQASLSRGATDPRLPMEEINTLQDLMKREGLLSKSFSLGDSLRTEYLAGWRPGQGK